MNIRKLSKWVRRVVMFPFVLAIWLVGGIVIVGLVAPFDWLINPDKWNGFERKDRKNG
jgi:hypothetical protein